jgi:hypothetical protein
MDTPKLVPQFEAELTISDTDTAATSTHVRLVGNNLADIKDLVGRLLGGAQPQFNDTEAGCALITHASFQRGRDPVGWINALNIPRTMSVAEKRMAA